jgi:hypothetical protein
MKSPSVETGRQLIGPGRLAEANSEFGLTDRSDLSTSPAPISQPNDREYRRAVLEAARAGAAKAATGPSAARSQDFLYGEDGLPEFGRDV